LTYPLTELLLIPHRRRDLPVSAARCVLEPENSFDLSIECRSVMTCSRLRGCREALFRHDHRALPLRTRARRGTSPQRSQPETLAPSTPRPLAVNAFSPPCQSAPESTGQVPRNRGQVFRNRWPSAPERPASPSGMAGQSRRNPWPQWFRNTHGRRHRYLHTHWQVHISCDCCRRRTRAGTHRERTRCGVAAARRRGAHIGRPRARVDLEELATLRLAGKSVREIAQALKVGVGTVHRLLQVGVPERSRNRPPMRLQNKGPRDRDSRVRESVDLELESGATPPSQSFRIVGVLVYRPGSKIPLLVDCAQSESATGHVDSNSRPFRARPYILKLTEYVGHNAGIAQPHRTRPQPNASVQSAR